MKSDEPNMQKKQDFGKMVINYLQKYYLTALNASRDFESSTKIGKF